MLKAAALIAGSLLLGAAPVIAAEQIQQLAQAPNQIDQDYQRLMRSAKTPQDRARIQADYERAKQQSAVPNSGGVRTAPGTAGSGAVPSTRSSPSNNPGESPTGGGGKPPGQ